MAKALMVSHASLPLLGSVAKALMVSHASLPSCQLAPAWVHGQDPYGESCQLAPAWVHGQGTHGESCQLAPAWASGPDLAAVVCNSAHLMCSSAHVRCCSVCEPCPNQRDGVAYCAIHYWTLQLLLHPGKCPARRFRQDLIFLSAGRRVYRSWSMQSGCINLR